MEESYIKASSSLIHIREIDDVKKADRFYLRYYLTIKKARSLNEAIYGEKTAKGGL